MGFVSRVNFRVQLQPRVVDSLLAGVSLLLAGCNPLSGGSQGSVIDSSFFIATTPS